MSNDGCAFRFEYPEPHQDHDPGCQFTSETNFYDCGGKRFCRFHLPAMDDTGHPTAKGRGELDQKAFYAAFQELIGGALDAEGSLNLTGVIFAQVAVFDEVSFPESLWYGACFHSHASFENAVFEGNAWFSGADFRATAYFTRAEFKRAPVFESAKFQRAVFENAEFRGNVSFKDVVFQRAAYFRGVAFLGGAVFSGAEFQGTAIFRDAVIRAYASFKAAEFRRDAIFRDTGFQGEAIFRGTEFLSNAVFRHTKFRLVAVFADAHFHRVAYFGNAQFQRAATFRDTEFSGNAIFTDVKFHRDADFAFSGQTSRIHPLALAEDDECSNPAKAMQRIGAFQRFEFGGAFVAGVTDFSNRTFREVTNFSGRRFDQAPKFHNCELHHDTIWPGPEAFPDRTNPHAASAYRRLRLAMEQIRDRPQEAIFFALEQEAMRRTMPWWQPDRWLSALYQWTSRYGQSWVRPLLWLAGTWISFFMVYWILDGQQPLDLVRAKALLTFTFQQVVKPFAVWGRYIPELMPPFTDEFQLAFKLLATLQSILSITFLALLILALRWQFKRG